MFVSSSFLAKYGSWDVVPQPGIKIRAVESQSPNHKTARELPLSFKNCDEVPFLSVTGFQGAPLNLAAELRASLPALAFPAGLAVGLLCPHPALPRPWIWGVSLSPRGSGEGSCGQRCPDLVRSKFGAQRCITEHHGAPFSGISSVAVFTFRGSLKGLAPGRLLMRGQRCEFLDEISQVLNV